MKRLAILKMPRLNANEDEARIAAISIGAGDAFDAGIMLFSVETSKAANDVISPCSGRMERFLVAIDDVVPVGAPICEALLEHEVSGEDLDFIWADEAETAKLTRDSSVRHPSAKAKARARELGIDIDDVLPGASEVKVADVERHEQSRRQHAQGPTAFNAAPTIRETYGPTDAVIFGGSGHARAVMDAARGCGYTIVGGVDAQVPAGTPILEGVTVLGTEALLAELRERGIGVAFVGVGGATSNDSRRRVFERLVELGFHLPPLVAPGAHLGAGSVLGTASYLFPGANVGPGVKIGANCIINQNAVVAHDSVIENHVHLAPNAVIAGHCRVGAGSTIGMCTTLINGGRVGRNCLIHNNVALASNVPDGSIVTLEGQRRPARDPIHDRAKS